MQTRGYWKYKREVIKKFVLPLMEKDTWLLLDEDINARVFVVGETGVRVLLVEEMHTLVHKVKKAGAWLTLEEEKKQVASSGGQNSHVGPSGRGSSHVGLPGGKKSSRWPS